MSDQRPIPLPLREHLRELRLRALPFAVWLAACGLVAVLWMQTPAMSPLTGLAMGEQLIVRAPEGGEVEELFVAPFQDVRQGQPLLALNSQALQAELLVAQSELARLQAEWAAAQATMEQLDEQERQLSADRVAETELEFELDRARRLRSFRVAEQSAELDLLQASLERVSRDLERERVQIQLTRAQGLLEEGVGSEAEVEDLQAELAQLTDVALASAGLEERAREAVAESQRWRLEFEQLEPEASARVVLDPRTADRLAGFEASVALQRVHLANLESRTANLLLRAPRSGRVASLLATPGLLVQASEELLQLESVNAPGILVYLPEQFLGEVAVGDRMTVRRGMEEAESVVVAGGAGVKQIPARLWLDPRIAEFGLAVQLSPPVGMALRPGERVGVARLD